MFQSVDSLLPFLSHLRVLFLAPLALSKIGVGQGLQLHLGPVDFFVQRSYVVLNPVRRVGLLLFLRVELLLSRETLEILIFEARKFGKPSWRV